MGKLRKIMKKLFLILCLFSLSFMVKAEQPPKFTDEQINEIGVQHNRLLEMHLRSMIEKKLDFMEFDNFSEIIKIQKSNTFASLSGSFNPTNEEISASAREIEVAREKLHNIFEATTNISELNSEINSEMAHIKSNFDGDHLSYNLILYMYSVAKHSANFWYSTDNGGSGLALSLLREISIDLEQKAKITGKKLAEEDAYGAAKGGLSFVGAAILGGPVTLTVFAGYCLGGAALQSLDALWDAKGIDFTPQCLINSNSDFNLSSCMDKANSDYELIQCYNNFVHKWRCCKLLGFKEEGCKIFMPPKK